MKAGRNKTIDLSVEEGKGCAYDAALPFCYTGDKKLC